MTAFPWRGFFLCQLTGLGLLASWLWPATRAGWDLLDQAVFFALNGTLATPSPWAAFWAVLNFRAMDLLPLVFLLPFLLVPGLVLPRHSRATACLHLLLVLFTMLVFRLLVEALTEGLGWRGNSPSRTLVPAYLLSELYPGLDPKDGSNQSFPGDHASVLMIVAIFLFLQGLNRWSVLIGAVSLFFMLPRLFSGAHWLTDIVVGGSLIASQSLAFGYFTPWPRRWAERLAQRWVPARWQ